MSSNEKALSIMILIIIGTCANLFLLYLTGDTTFSPLVGIFIAGLIFSIMQHG